MFLTWVIACCLGLIPLGSTAAFINIQTIGNSGLLVSYLVCIASRLYHRNAVGLYGNLSKPPSFFLGKTIGNIVNTLAILFLICFLVSGMFPLYPNPTLSSMNFSSLALGTTLIISIVAYVWLKKSYLGAGVGGSVELVDIHADGKSFDQQT